MLDLGEQIAGYRLERVLGRGGMGVVYEATQLSLNRAVALKVIAPGVSNDVAFRERFRREGPLQARIDHAHIVSVFEAGESDGHLFLAMRLVRGPSLREIVLSGPLTADRALRILTPVADALDTAHEEALIHRDVKPHNILVGRGDHAFLADFGLTKSVGESSLTKSGHFVGTLNYVAPEQIQGEEASRASDIYALAAVLFETLTGAPPFERQTEAATLYAHVADPPPRPSDARPELGRHIDEVIARGLAKQPDDRPTTALALMDAAERALRQGTPRRRSPASVVTPMPARTRPAPLQMNATTDVLADPDLTAHPATDTDEAPVPAAVAVPAEPPAATTAAAHEPATATVGPPAGQASAAQPAPGRSARPRVAAVLIAILALAGGDLAGSGLGADHAAPARDTVVGNDAFALRVPAAWTQRTPVPEVPGLRLERAIAYGPRARSAAALLVGVARDGAGPTLLPGSFRRRLPSEPAPSDRVRLGVNIQALRFSRLTPTAGGSALTLLVLPTDAGALIIVCLEAEADQSFVDACLHAATTLRLRRLHRFGLGGDATYAGRLTSTLTRLQVARAAALARLRGAGTPSGQARRATEVAAAYRSAASSLAATPANPFVRGHNADIRTILRAQAGGYAELARAAALGQRVTYRREVASIAARDGELRAAIAGLRDVGFG